MALLAHRAGYLAALEAFGGTVTVDTCILASPMLPPEIKRLMTNSAKYAITRRACSRPKSPLAVWPIVSVRRLKAGWYGMNRCGSEQYTCHSEAEAEESYGFC